MSQSASLSILLKSNIDKQQNRPYQIKLNHHIQFPEQMTDAFLELNKNSVNLTQEERYKKTLELWKSGDLHNAIYMSIMDPRNIIEKYVWESYTKGSELNSFNDYLLTNLTTYLNNNNNNKIPISSNDIKTFQSISTQTNDDENKSYVMSDKKMIFLALFLPFTYFLLRIYK